MRKMILLVLFFCLFCLCEAEKIYCEDLSITQKIEKVYDNFSKNEKIAKITISIKSGWKSFKNWVANLPGIREYDNSVCSGKNWKKIMNDIGKADNAYGKIAQMLRFKKMRKKLE